KSLRHVEGILCGLYVALAQRDTRQRIFERRRRKLLCKLDVVTNAIVDGKSLCDPPGVLGEERNELVLEAAVRITKTLKKDAWKTEAISLYWRKRRTRAARDQTAAGLR